MDATQSQPVCVIRHGATDALAARHAEEQSNKAFPTAPGRLLIISAYNEADNIERTLTEIRQQVSGDFDLLVVDDCSTDETAPSARRAGAVVLNLSQNLGYGGAVETGLKHAVRHGYSLGVLIEVGDRRLCGIICPGKNSYASRDGWIRRAADSVAVSGEGNVLPTFVAGVEMCQP